MEVENGCYGTMKTNENISACQFMNFIFIVQDINFSIHIDIKPPLTMSRITVVRGSGADHRVGEPTLTVESEKWKL